jgi:hypothetical protein
MNNTDQPKEPNIKSSLETLGALIAIIIIAIPLAITIFKWMFSGKTGKLLFWLYIVLMAIACYNACTGAQL